VRIWRHSSGVVARRRIDARNHLPRLAAPALDVEGWRKQRRAAAHARRHLLPVVSSKELRSSAVGSRVCTAGAGRAAWAAPGGGKQDGAPHHSPITI
jgi:hypothetical protein